MGRLLSEDAAPEAAEPGLFVGERIIVKRGLIYSSETSGTMKGLAYGLEVLGQIHKTPTGYSR